MCYLPRGSLEVRRCSPQRSPTVHSGQDCGVQLQARGEHVHHHSACMTERLQPLSSILYSSLQVVTEALHSEKVQAEV